MYIELFMYTRNRCLRVGRDRVFNFAFLPFAFQLSAYACVLDGPPIWGGNPAAE